MKTQTITTAGKGLHVYIMEVIDGQVVVTVLSVKENAINEIKQQPFFRGGL